MNEPTVDVKLVDQLADQIWRLNNLYYIADENGKLVLFKPNVMQELFLHEMWYANAMVKGRQHGFTTAICIYMLDCALFTPHMTCGIIAHTLDDVRKIFRRKIKAPFDNLPGWMREQFKPTNDTLNEMIFPNGSEISVDTSVRSGTYHYLLISEYATISHQYPEKAAEIKTGSFNTIHPGNYIFVESTGKGKGGEFFDLIQKSKKLAASGRTLTELDFKYHFYPWWMNPKYRLTPEQTRTIVFTRQHQDYFAKVESGLTKRATFALEKLGRAATPAYLRAWLDLGCKLSLEQRAWYIVKKDWNGDEMKREYPSTEDEPFEAVLKGAIFAEKMQEARDQGRITKVPHEPNLAVDTWWDIGRRDNTAIWFVQTIGLETRFIHYHQESFKELPYYLALCSKLRDEKRWHYRHHLGPHDLGVVDFGGDQNKTGVTRAMKAALLGYPFIVGEQWDQKDQIDAGRNMLANCWFDEENCAEGVVCLEQFRREWSEHLQTYMDSYRHDEYSHGSSAFMTGAMLRGYVRHGKPKARAVATQRFPT